MKFFKFYANASSTPPAPMPNPSYGYPSNGDIAAGIPPTILGAEWVYNLGMEMTALIELGGMEPSDENLHQLADFFVNFKAAMEDLQRQAASGAGTATELSQNMAQIRTDAEAARDAAISAKNTAVSSAGAAKASETAAAGSATTATQKANAAASSATTASQKASAAATSEQNAASSAAAAEAAKLKAIESWQNAILQVDMGTAASTVPNLRIRRILESERATYLRTVPLIGSIYYDTTAKTIRIGDGNTQGGISVGGVPTGTMITYFGRTIPDGYLLCNGGTIRRADYPELAAILAQNPETAGDGSTTVTLPNLLDRFIEYTTDISKVGEYVDAGLPSMTGLARLYHAPVYITNGVFSMGSTSKVTPQSSTGLGTSDYLYFDASKSNSLYGGSSTVQPESIRALPLIKT